MIWPACPFVLGQRFWYCWRDSQFDEWRCCRCPGQKYHSSVGQDQNTFSGNLRKPSPIHTWLVCMNITYWLIFRYRINHIQQDLHLNFWPKHIQKMDFYGYGVAIQPPWLESSLMRLYSSRRLNNGEYCWRLILWTQSNNIV